MAKKQEDISAQMLANLSRQQYAYGFGGGTIGGDIWNIRQPTSMEMLYGKREPIVELKPEYRGKVNVTPAGRGSAQELRGMREAGGRPYVEAPELYKRGGGTSGQDRSSQFYSTATGRPMGSMMGMGGYGGFGGGVPQSSQGSWDNYVDRIGPRNPQYGSNPEKIAKAKTRKEMKEANIMGYSGGSMAFTPFGETIGMQPTAIARSPFEGRDIRSLTGFGGIPAFPYANY
jgi:hypothetical protein